MRHSRLLAVLVTAASAVVPVPAVAQERATVAGVVLSAGGDPAADAEVVLPELRRRTMTDAEGRFHIPDLPAGEYLLSASSPRFGSAVQRVTVAEGSEISLEIRLDRLMHSGAISVTAAGVARSLSELTTPVDVLTGEDLVFRRQSTLGETLAQQPGVTSTTYGQGSSRPVIRGLGEDRIRILENGLDTGDVSSIGPDHAVSMDPLAAEQVEVVRGPATVLWGANAIGGVVNVLDGRVPDRAASSPVTGVVEVEGSSNADKLSGAVKLDGGSGRWAWHLDLYARDQGDYSSPARRPVDGDEHGHEEEAEEHEGEHGEERHEEYETGTVENTWAEAQGATLGASYITDRGFIGLAVGGYDTRYGIPGHHHHGEEDEHEHALASSIGKELRDGDDEGVHSDLEQRRVDLHSQLDAPFTGFSALRFSAGWRDYTHQEVEGDELGTQFNNRWTEARLDLLNERFSGFEGTLGLHYVKRDFEAFGEEAFVAPTDTTRLGAYIFQETNPEPVGFQFGLRIDRQDTTTVDPQLPDRDFSTWTASAGLVWRISEAWNLGINLNRPERSPTPEELYSDGPHAATFAYEIGDPFLEPEVGNGAEATLRVERGPLEASLTGFVTRYDSFIYLADTGEEIDGFEVLQFSQDDARFAGFELHGHYELVHAARSHVHLGVSFDQVRAEFSDSGEPLPRIPPRRGRLALVYLGERWDARLEGWWVDDQTRVAEHESPTPGYRMLNASISHRIFTGASVHELMLRGRNLTDEAAYNHVSFLKLQAPLPGRDLSLVYRLVF